MSNKKEKRFTMRVDETIRRLFTEKAKKNGFDKVAPFLVWLVRTKA